MGFNYLFFLLVMLPSEIPGFPTDPLVIWCFGVSKHQCFLVFGNFSFKTPFLGMDPLPYLFCLSFYLLYFVLPPFKDNGWLSGCLMSSASIQKLFCGICSAFKCSFDEFVGEKVVSLTYSSAILGPLPSMSFLIESFSEFGISVIVTS